MNCSMEYYMTNTSSSLAGKETLFKFDFFPHATWRLNIIKKTALGLILCHLNAIQPSHTGSLWFF